MKNITLLLLLLFTLSCNAQIISLETKAQCMQENPPISCPDNWTYVKDINNSLDKFYGTWKGVHDGKTYEIKFKKGLYQDLTLSERKSDILIGRLRVTTTGNLPLTIFDNFNEPDDNKTEFSGLGFQKDLNYYMLSFSGSYTDVCLNSGTVYISILPNQINQMNLIYLLDTDFYSKECPSSFQTTIPEKQNITLIKQ